MNKENGRYIQQWKGYSNSDIVPNIQKLALFTRTMRLTKQTDEFLAFDPNRWDIVFEGIVRKPREMIMPILEYKANSGPINMALSGFEKMTLPLKNSIDKITNYIKDAIVIDNGHFKLDAKKEEIPDIVYSLVQKGFLIYGIKEEERTLEQAFLEKTGGNIIE